MREHGYATSIAISRASGVSAGVPQRGDQDTITIAYRQPQHPTSTEDYRREAWGVSSERPIPHDQEMLGEEPLPALEPNRIGSG